MSALSRWRSIPFVLAALLAAGCGDHSTTGPAPGNQPDPEVQPEPATVEEFLAAYKLAWETKELDALDALLTADFTYHILDQDADDLPWLGAKFWERDQELDFAGNMFDPNFLGNEPPVQVIQFDYAILNQRVAQDPDGVTVTEVTLDVVITVLTGPTDGFACDTRFILDLVQDADGHFHVKRIQEVLKLSPRSPGSGSVDTSSWGRIKALYASVKGLNQ